MRGARALHKRRSLGARSLQPAVRACASPLPTVRCMYDYMSMTLVRLYVLKYVLLFVTVASMAAHIAHQLTHTQARTRRIN